MKKLLSIIGTISLITSGSSNLICCKNDNEQKDKKSSNENNQKQSEKPRKNSNWKLVEDKFNDFWELTPNNKWYILILENFRSKTWDIMKINLNLYPRKIKFEKNTLLDSVYRWDGVGEPNAPTIDLKTGQINNWKI